MFARCAGRLDGDKKPTNYLNRAVKMAEIDEHRRKGRRIRMVYVDRLDPCGSSESMNDTDTGEALAAIAHSASPIEVSILADLLNGDTPNQIAENAGPLYEAMVWEFVNKLRLVLGESGWR